MKNSFAKVMVTLILTAVILTACLPGGAAVPDDKASANAIATGVAATLAAAAESPEATATPVAPPSPTWTIHPTVTASPPQANFNYAGVSFYFHDLLADNITAGVNPGQYDENNPWWSYPEHRSYLFNGWVLSDAFHDAKIRIYPAADFKALNENVSEGLDSLEVLLEADQLDADALTVPNIFNAGQLYHSNAKKLPFQNGSGVRWLSQYGQAFFPIGWPNLFYTYQGFTDDGKYYLSIIFPVNHPSLPHPDNVALDQTFADNFQTYAENTRLALEAEADNSFIPSLVLLDQLVTSLTVGEP